MMVDVTCPYCDEEFEEELDSDIQEDQLYEAECPNCEKVFGYNLSFSISAYSRKLPCGGQFGEGPHKWKPVRGFPEEYVKNKFYCEYCGAEKTENSEK